MSKCIVLLSGGMDSATLLALAIQRYEKVMALSINYAQRHKIELQSAQAVAEHFQIHHEILDITNINHLLAGSSLTSGTPVPHGHYEDETMKQTVVPARNTILLSIAAGWAISQKFNTVAYAAHAGDHAIYPDCRLEYVLAMQKVFDIFDYQPIDLWTPFLDLDKAGILKVGMPLGVPYEKTWTCYDPQGPDPYGDYRACSKCGSCQERLESFAKIGQVDPIKYLEG
jgi:7-cyano-7-deazaguanine synthase